MRRLHRLLGLLLLLPLVAWTVTGLAFHLKPGWAGAYEQLHGFEDGPLDPSALLPPADLPVAGEGAAWELGLTAVGPVYRVSREAGPLLVHAATGTILSPLDRAAVEAIARRASSRAAASARYGDVREVLLTDREGVVRFAGGAEVRVGRYDLSVAQRGPDTAWIDRLYELHYLQWSGIEAIDRALAPIAIVAVWLLAFTGARKLRRGPRSSSSARVTPIPGASTRGEEVRRGDIHWLAAVDAGGDHPHPHVVVQDDVLNRSRISTVVVCALTSNLHRAGEPGNVLLDAGEGGLPKRSVVVVSQILSVDRSRLGERIGSLSDARVNQVLDGLRFQQRAFFERSS